MIMILELKNGAMNKLFFDIETNSKLVQDAEIIDAYFYLADESYNKIDEYRMLSQVDRWSEQAQEVHGISYAEMLCYSTKKQAYDDLLTWLSKHKPYQCVCYANPNVYQEETKVSGYFHFDIAVFKMQMNYLYENHVMYHIYFDEKNIYSPYLEIKKLHKDNKLNISRNKNLSQFSMENVYVNLFNKSYNAHNAKDDVMAMIEICKEIDRIKIGENIFKF